MVRINLLPWREARRRQQQRDFLSLLAAAGLLAVLSVVGLHMYIAGMIEAQEARNQFLRDRIQQLQQAAQRIQQMDQTKDRLEGRLESIESLQASRPDIVRVLDELVRLTPGSIFLRSFEARGNALTLRGVASSNNVVSEYMRNLEGADTFQDPVLKIIETTEVNGVRASTFELTVNRRNNRSTDSAGGAS
ncbi:MAG: PilN domain-containing protein [Candidatus Competibacteraceae bacterium]|nr:PilN domain-containing protein [Candidatus Competibacteraceae bacterium]